MRVVLGFLLVQAHAAVNASANGCSSLVDCGACVDHTVLGSHSCYWCQIDAKCHAVGSATSPCTPIYADDACISKSIWSTCDQKTVSACSPDQRKEPRQIHLAVAGARGMRVAWKTRGRVTDAHILVSIQMSKDAGKKVPAEKSMQYLKDQGFHHVATLTDLTPGQQYEYRVVCDGVTSTSRSFKVPAEDLSKATFLVVGDMGYGEVGQAVQSRKRLEALKASTDMTINLGDVGYADDSFMHAAECVFEFCYESVYDNFMDWIENLTDNKPYMVTPGNHESECHSPACLLSPVYKESLRNFSAYNARWAMPSRESGGAHNMWYSFDYGPVHFVSLNTETDFPDAASEKYGACTSCKMPAGSFGASGAYLQWLENDLQNANKNRAVRPWIVTFGHRPWLWQNGTDFIDAPGVKASHEKLFEKYAVDMFLAGHIHAYHRMSPADGSMPTIVSGGAGCDEGFDDPWSSFLGPSSGTLDITGKTAAFDYRTYTLDHQVGTLEASQTSLIWKAIASTSGNVIDTVTVTKAQLTEAFV